MTGQSFRSSSNNYWEHCARTDLLACSRGREGEREGEEREGERGRERQLGTLSLSCLVLSRRNYGRRPCAILALTQPAASQLRWQNPTENSPEMCYPLIAALRHLKILKFVIAALQRLAPKSATDEQEETSKTVSPISLRR